MKKYIAPAIRVKKIVVESLMQSLSGSTSGGDNIHEGGDGDAGDEGRAKSFNSWSEE